MSDPSEPDPFADAALPSDPLADPLHDEHPGVVALREAVARIDAGNPARARESLRDATSAGLPVELVPFAAVVAGVAEVLDGAATEALDRLTDAWRAHPDHAALPAALGAAHLAAGDAMSAAHTMFAALLADDPDRSLATHRRRLTQLLGHVR